MAKLSSLFKFEGTLDDVTAYQTKNGTVVRRKGGLSKERIATDPKLHRIRENNEEFGTVASAAKLMKLAFNVISKPIGNASFTPRLMKTLTGAKNLDSTSIRGQRKVGIGLASPEGKALLKGFQINGSVGLESILQVEYSVDSVTGEINIPGLVPNSDLIVAKGANKVGIKAMWANIDFDAQVYKAVQSNTVYLPINGASNDVTLNFIAPPVGTGIQVMVLAILFFQEMNGVDYLLSNGARNVADIIEVS